MRTQSEMLSDKPDDPEGGVRGPPDEGEGDVVVKAGNLEYLQSHVVDRNSLLSLAWRERWRSSLAKMAKSSDASRVMLSSVADRSADSGTSSAVVRRDDNWISWRVLATFISLYLLLSLSTSVLMT